ncbi:AcrR family transcriptional regulator [Litorivivens lipolytica]|uniref:AcrR family transcriptional regulator n=1 Tax=Litorivivens lipolytica TaxID=1524264 RepID=A0A7W4W2I6_9GAMM|nr:TetR/AcrR family transcriptional regulator [Litorivivens lipolytica]MBB3046194.1 AcrR family transcriptional regulator [Litorivivens lipolytica]
MSNQSTSSYHHGNLREELITHAEKHLLEGGINELSLRALAREIGVSQTAPYRHFKDKNALLAALATEGFSRLLTQLNEHSSGEDPIQDLIALGMDYVHFAQENTEIFRLMFGPVLLPRKQYTELFAAGREAFYHVQRIIERGAEQGIFGKDDIPSMAHTAWAGVHGVATLILDHGDSFGYYHDLDSQAQKSLKIMVEGLKTHAAA